MMTSHPHLLFLCCHKYSVLSQVFGDEADGMFMSNQRENPE